MSKTDGTVEKALEGLGEKEQDSLDESTKILHDMLESDDLGGLPVTPSRLALTSMEWEPKTRIYISATGASIMGAAKEGELSDVELLEMIATFLMSVYFMGHKFGEIMATSIAQSSVSDEQAMTLRFMIEMAEAGLLPAMGDGAKEE